MSQLQILESLGLCDEYYQLCKAHPLRVGEPIEKMPAKEILKSAEGVIEISKLKGPGSVYQAEGLPDGLSLRFIVQSRTTVETDLNIDKLKRDKLGTFAIMCLAAIEAANSEKPNPPYPRPEAHSKKELIEIFVKLKNLALKINESI